jgi:hypothetical protein
MSANSQRGLKEIARAQRFGPDVGGNTEGLGNIDQLDVSYAETNGDDVCATPRIELCALNATP